ncbi:MAG: hypothetical protein ACYS22_11860, partial [Planctomycetota bacterium]
TKTYQLALRFERILDNTPESIAVPFPRALDVLRESGFLALSRDEALKVRVTNTRGLSQLDPDEIPAELKRNLDLGFRYLAHPLELGLEVERIEPVIKAETASMVVLGREEDRFVGTITYTIQKAGIFEVAFQIPSSFRVETVGDDSFVDEFRAEDEGGVRTVTVSLSQKAIGTFKLPFQLVRDGTARAKDATVGPPVVLAVKQDRGLFAVTAPRSIELTTAELEGLTDADADALYPTGLMNQLPKDTAVPRAFRYREPGGTARVELEPRRTEIDVLAQHLVEVADGEVRTTHLLDYNVLHAPTETLQFRAPSVLDDVLKVDAQQKTEVKKEAGADGETIWTVSFQPPVLGAVTLTLTHQSELEGLIAGQARSVPIRLVRPLGARSEQGFVAIRKEGTLEIVPQAVDMEATTVSELPPKLRRGQIYSTFRYFAESPSLALELTRYDYTQLATTAVQLMHLKSLITEEGMIKTRATLFVQNTERQYLELVLGSGARILTLSVNGVTQAPKRKKDGAATLIQIPRSAGAHGTFPVVFVYEEPAPGGEMGSFGGVEYAAPRIAGGVPVQKTELELYLPPGAVYLSPSGSFSSMTRAPGLWGRFRSLITGTAAGAVSSRREPRFVVEGLAGIEIEIPTEGRELKRFESLTEEARLELSYMNNSLYWLLDFLIALGAAIGGVFALRNLFPKPLVGVVVLLLVGLLLSWFPSGAALGFAVAFLLGVGIASALVLGDGAQRRFARWRAQRLKLQPDPFLEEASAPVTTITREVVETEAPGAAAKKKASADKPAPEKEAEKSAPDSKQAKGKEGKAESKDKAGDKPEGDQEKTS